MTAEEIDVVVIGAGQAGLAASRELGVRGSAHVILERGDAVGGAWAGRWDSFCLVTPNHTIRLPGGEYRGPEPHGYLPRDQIVEHLKGYAAAVSAPVRTGVEVVSLRERGDGVLVVGTREGDTILSRHVVVATGAYQVALRPAWVANAPTGLPVLDATGYRNPSALPPGAVLVVGSGQTGCQLAEELALAGRRVVLACGRAPWIPRRVEGRDTVDWLLETPFFDVPVSELPSPAARLLANPQATGAHGGHDCHSRTLAALGVELAGHLVGLTQGGVAMFQDDLAETLSWGDQRYAEIRQLIQGWCVRHCQPVPEMPDPAPFDPSTALHSLDLREVAVVILAAGFRPDYGWIDIPGTVDDMGFPHHIEGTSTASPGLHFVGVHFLRTRGSSLLMGVGRDASVVADTVAGSLPGL